MTTTQILLPAFNFNGQSLKLPDKCGPTILDHTKQHCHNKRSMITPEAWTPVIMNMYVCMYFEMGLRFWVLGLRFLPTPKEIITGSLSPFLFPATSPFFQHHALIFLHALQSTIWEPGTG